MNAMLTDEELQRLLDEAAGSFVVPAPDLDLPQQPEKRLWQRRWPQAGAAAAVLVAGSLFLSTLGGGSGADTAINRLSPGADQGGSALGAVAPPVAAQRGPLAATSSDRSTGSGGTAGSANAGSPGRVKAVGDGDTARVVRTGSLSLVVDEGRVGDTVKAVLRLVKGVGGYSSDSTSDLAGDRPSSSLTVRVPVAAFDGFLEQVQNLKVKVVSATQSGKDITATYADTQAQIQSLRAARDRYLAILARAKTIGETLTVQQRIDDVQQQIDRLEGQRRVLADQSDYATVTISVGEKQDAKAFLTKEPSGWSKAWDDAKHGFSSGVQSLIAHSGRTLLVLIVGAALLLLGRTGWRLARRRLV